jgi:O-antigen ligase
MNRWFEHRQQIVNGLLVLFVFFIPVSTAVTNVILGLVLLFWLLDNGSDRFAGWGRILKSNPVAVMGLVVFLMHVAGLAYTDGQTEKIIESLSDGARFLFIGMMMVYFTEGRGSSAVVLSFLSVMAGILFLSCLLWLDLLPTIIAVKGDASNAVIFHDHIKHNSFMAFAAFAAGVKARQSGAGPVGRGLWALFSLLALFNVLFMVAGRTGHVIAAVLGVYYFITWDLKKSLAAGGVVLILLGAFAWFNPSNPLFLRAQTAIEEAREWDYGKPADITSSSGLRLEWFFNSLQIIGQNPVLGTGTGSFDATYGRFVAGTQMLPTDNPHNEYLMTAVQFGLMGLLVLLIFFGVQWRCAGALKDRDQALMGRGFVLLMMTACLTASPLQDSAEGWFFAVMSAVLFAGTTSKNGLTNQRVEAIL